MDRTEFAHRQAEMTEQWYRGVLGREADVESYMEGRRVAYLDRWREAGRFIADGARVLDIGGGGLYPALLNYLSGRGFDYWYLDVDAGKTNSSRDLAHASGFRAEQFETGFNDTLGYRDGSFDAVFSSHCLEHSYDLKTTLAEIHRVLASDGFLLMAVPLGWERNPEHPYFFGPDDWIALVEDAGFTIRVTQIGREYPEHGYDHFIAARRNTASLTIPRINPDRRRKTNFALATLDEPSIRFDGPAERRGDMVICRNDWSIHWTAPAGTSEILPILARHAWSGIVEITAGTARSVCDLFSWFSYVQPASLLLGPPTTAPVAVRVAPVGRNPAAWATEGVLYGFLYR